MGQRIVALDTSVFIYLLEDHPSYAERAARVLREVRDGKCSGVFASVGMIELLTGPKKEGRYDIAVQYERHIASFPHLVVAPLSERVIWLASDMRAQYDLRTPDAVHIATAIDMDADVFLTNDKALRKVREVSVEML